MTTPDTMISAVDRAKRKLREMVSSGQLVSGQKIDQRVLAKELGLTTAPLREALSCLEAEGLMQRIPGMGIYCKVYTVDEIQDLIEIRGVLEGLAAKRAAMNLTESAKIKLYELAKKISDPGSFTDQEAFVRQHIDFHNYIAELSGSDSLKQLLERNHLIQQVLSNIGAGIWPVAPHDHTHIVDAIASGDPEKAEQVVRNHIYPTFADRIEELRKQFGSGPVIGNPI